MRVNTSRTRGHRRLVVSRLWAVVAAVLVASMVAAGPVGAQEDAGSGFSDVTDGAHKPAIDALAEMGVFEGTECAEGMFCPGDEMKRWTMGVWLVRVLDDVEPAAVSESSFADVESDEWWLAHVERLAELEVTKGCKTEPLRYCPDRSVTRAQTATFLVRAFDLAVAEPAGFTDTAGNTHETNIDALAAARVTAGCKADPLSYCPAKSVTRAQMATILARALGLVEVPTPTEDTEEDESVAFSSVAAGADHYCGLRVDGTATCWGNNSRGQLDVPEGIFSMVSAGGSHTCGLRPDGSVECWGSNDDGQTYVAYETFSTVTAGTWHSCGMTTDGFIECWGFGADDAPDRGGFTTVSAGRRHTCALRTSGIALCWGSNAFGQSNAPRGTFKAIDVGVRHTCGLRIDGSVECWGSNVWKSFVGLTDAPSGTFTAIDVGALHSCGLRPDGTIECWGLNTYGQTDPPSGSFVAISAGGSSISEHGLSCGVRTNGAIRCWGSRDPNS